jgi:hypothetical protein
MQTCTRQGAASSSHPVKGHFLGFLLLHNSSPPPPWSLPPPSHLSQLDAQLPPLVVEGGLLENLRGIAVWREQ